jgi:hypothetical protein
MHISDLHTPLWLHSLSVTFARQGLRKFRLQDRYTQSNQADFLHFLNVARLRFLVIPATFSGQELRASH